MLFVLFAVALWERCGCGGRKHQGLGRKPKNFELFQVLKIQLVSAKILQFRKFHNFSIELIKVLKFCLKCCAKCLKKLNFPPK